MEQKSTIHGKESEKKNLIRRKLFKHRFILLIAVLVVLSTAIAQTYGPYMGKVVDLETGAPIEGAAVLVVFFTESVYADRSYADAVETLTDKNGKFKIPWHLAITFHPLSVWKSNGYITVFKPGYGVYPDHVRAEPMFEIGGTIPKKEYVTIKLPKLGTTEERRENLRNARLSGDIPERKTKKMLDLIYKEDVNVGLKSDSEKLENK